MVCKGGVKIGKVAVLLLLFAVVGGALTGAAAATDDGNVTTEGDTIAEENSSGLTATSADSDGSTIDTTESDDSCCDGTEVAVAVFPTGASFASDETMDIFVGSFNDSEPRSTVGNVELNVTITSPDGTTTTRTVTTDADGLAQTTYDFATDSQNGTYQVTVENGSASATVSPSVGPTIAPAERTFEQVPIGERTDLDFLVRNGEFGQANEPVNVTIEDPDGTVIEEYQTETGEDGFLNVSLTPQQQGQYVVTAEVPSTGASDTHSVNAGEMVFRTSLFDLTQGVAGEQSYYGGYVLDGDGLVRNTDVVVEFRNQSDVIVANETATTGNNGFLNVGYVVSNSDVPNGDLDVNMRTVDGTQVLTSTGVDVDDSTPDQDDGDGSEGVELSFQEREFSVAPGDNSTYDIELTDNGSAVANQDVTVFARLGFQGPPIASQTVTTDQNGQAVVEVATSNAYVGANIDATARVQYDGSTFSSSEFTNIEQYDINLDTPYGVTAGQEVNFTVRAENISSNGVGEGIPVQFNALSQGDDIDSYATEEVVTNESGIGVETVYVPRDIEPYNAWTDANRYDGGRLSGYRVNVFELPGSAAISGDREVAPGEQVSVNFTTPDGTSASGVVFAEFDYNGTDAEGNSIATVSSSADGTLTVPTYAADDNYAYVEVWAADANGNFYTANTYFEVNRSSSDSGTPIDVSLTSSANTVEAGTNVTLNVTANQSAQRYDWDTDGDGTAEESTSSSTLVLGPTTPSTYNVTVTAVSTDGDTASASTSFDVVDTTAPTAVVESPSTVVVGESVTFDASNSTDNSDITNYSYTVTNSSGGSESLASNTSTAQYQFQETGNYTVSMTVNDAGGNTNTTTRNISVVAAANLETNVTVQDPQRYDGNVTATITVTNTGTENVTAPFRVGYTYAGEGHSDGVVYNATESLTVNTTIQSGSSVNRTVNITDWVRSNRITGVVSIEADADVDGNVSEARIGDNIDAAGFEVTYPDLVASVSSPTADTTATNTTIRAYVRNSGTATSSAANVTVTVVDSGGTTVYSAQREAEGLAPDTQNLTKLDTSLAAGTYTVTVEVADGEFPAGNTATTNVTIEEYSLTAGSAITPSELEVGQNATVAFRFEPNDDAEVNATLLLEGSGLAFQRSSGDNVTNTVQPEANQLNTVTYDVQGVNATGAPTTLNFTVEETNGADAANRTAATNVTIVTETVRNSTALTHESTDQTANISVYNSGVTESHSLEVSVQAGANGRTLQGLEYLVNYPYGCVEQTTSAFLGALNTDQYYRDRPNTTISDSRQAVINGSIADGVTRLNKSGIRAQQSDGSWNMWGRTGADGDTFYSVYALYGTSSVANDEVYGPQNSESLDGVDFDQAVVWLNDEDQNADGSFSAYSYIEDEAAMTGFTMVAVDNAAQTERVSDDTLDNITELQGEGVDYLLSQQANGGSWNGGDARSTALAVRGLQVALDNGAAQEADANASEIRTAIDDGREWLVANQNGDGSWDPYHDSSYWNEEGDASVTTAYAMLALNETGMEATNTTIIDGTDYLTTVYENDGSWGYPRATAISIDALDKLTGVETSGEMTIELNGAGTVSETVTVNATTPQVTISLTESQLDTLRGSGNGTTNVTVTVSDAGDSGTIIVGVENSQEIVAASGSDS